MSTDFKDYYLVLGIPKTASAEEIKKSYRRLARKYHPDMNPGDKAAENRFREVTEAYEVLADTEKRSKYDQFGKYWKQPAPTSTRTTTSYRSSSPGGSAADSNYDFAHYGSFDEFLNELLGRKAGTARPKAGGEEFAASTSTNANGDRDATINLTMMEAFKGVEKSFTIGTENIKIRIPLGAKPGSRIRVKGKGSVSPYNQQRGDLYLTIAIKPHEFFQFDKENLTCEIPISPEEAVLGAQIQVPTPDGAVMLNVPAGVKSGQSLRLRGKGWYNSKGERGDQIAKLVIATPKNLSPTEKDLYEKLRKARSTDPRSNFSRITL